MRFRLMRAGFIGLLSLLALAGCHSQSQTHFNQGKMLYREGNYQKAVKKFQQAVKANPDKTLSVRVYLTKAYDKLDRPEKVTEWAREFLKKSEENAGQWADDRWTVMFLLEQALEEQGKELTESDKHQKEINEKYKTGWSGETGGMRRD